MPKLKSLIIVATLTAWFALAVPTWAGHYPDSPDGPRSTGGFVGSTPTLTAALRSANQAIAANAEAPAPPDRTISANLATLPHKALAAEVLPKLELPSPRLSLSRPFTDTQRQSPESTYPYGSKGNGRYVLHTGVDIMNPLGTPVRAVADGHVVFAGNDSVQAIGPRPGYYGNLIITQLDGTSDAEPVYVLFGHLDKVLVVTGQRVRTGEVVGLVGMTGIAIGPHLHMEVRQGQNNYETTRNPALWLGSLPAHGTLAGRIVDEAGRPVSGERLLIYRAERPYQVWRVVYSYLDSPVIHGDDFAAENFALPDVPAGAYRVVAGRGGASVGIPVTVEPGGLTLLEIKVEGGL